MITANCPLCVAKDEFIIYSNDIFRVILVDDRLYPGYIRLILNSHKKEMTDIEPEKASAIFRALLIIERNIRDIFNPDKINLACFGNMVPHLHWHIIPRYTNDTHFPNPIWGSITNPKYQLANTLFDYQDILVSQLKKSFSE